jgi:hypothetical protein
MKNRALKKIAFLLLGLFVVCLAAPLALFVTPAHAEDAGTCYTINDGDARTYCLARAHRDPSQCYAIQRPDLRAQCRAEVRK